MRLNGNNGRRGSSWPCKNTVDPPAHNARAPHPHALHQWFLVKGTPPLVKTCREAHKLSVACNEYILYEIFCIHIGKNKVYIQCSEHNCSFSVWLSWTLLDPMTGPLGVHWPQLKKPSFTPPAADLRKWFLAEMANFFLPRFWQIFMPR